MLKRAQIDELLKDRGMVLTSQRRRILDHLAGNLSHPTAAQIHKAVMPGVTLSTVYNTLALLKELGVVNELPQRGGESRFDPNTSAHHHLLCVDCGVLQDVPAQDVSVSLAWQVRLEDAQVSFRGHCGCTESAS